MTAKTRALIILAGLCLFDAVIPIPIVGLILIFVILQKPPWFQDMVEEIYGGSNGGP